MAIVSIPSDFVVAEDSATDPDVVRKSGIDAPTMQLHGQTGEVFALQFSHDGKNIATAGASRQILVYNVYGQCQTWAVLKGHKNAILEVKWSEDGTQMFSCSADHSLAVWDVEASTRIKKLNGHLSVVNSIATFSSAHAHSSPYSSKNEKSSEAHLFTHNKNLCSTNNCLISAGDDGTTRVWDTRTRKHVMKADHQYQILSVALDGHGGRVFAGSLDMTIRVYDLRSGLREMEVYKGHADSITGLDVNSLGTHLISNSMDQTIRLWDIQAFVASGNRQVGVCKGATHNFEKNLLRVRFSPDGSLAAAGSADRSTCIWEVADSLGKDTHTHTDKQTQLPAKRLLYRLPGHAGCVNDVAFHPSEPIIASAGSDKIVFMGELS